MARQRHDQIGAPAIEAAYERQSVDAKSATRLIALVAACWDVFDDVVGGRAPRS